jgi:alpha-L-rhamnosidase
MYLKLTSFFLALASLPALANLSPSQLKCEYSDNPLGIDNPQPRLSWILESKQRAEKQTAYQILAATSEALLKSDSGDLWDTGKVASDKSVQVVYAGKALGSCQRRCWKVRVWDKDGKTSGLERRGIGLSCSGKRCL